MQVKIGDTKNFQKSLEAILTIQEEVKMKFNNEGLEILAVDDGLVTMIKYSIPKEVFLEYEIEGEEEDILLNISELNAVVKKIKDNTIILKTENGRLKIIVEGNVKREFQIPLLEEIKKEIDRTPPIEWKNIVELEGDIVRDAIKDATFVDDAEINIKMDEEKLSFLAKSAMKEYKLEIPKDSSSVLSYEYKENIDNLYGMSQFEDLVNNIPKGSIVRLELANKTPLKLEFKIGMIKIMYIMADRG